MRNSFWSSGLCLSIALIPLSCAPFLTQTERETTHSRQAVAVRQIRASELLQVSVQSGEGESLGKLRDLIINPRTGQIESALVSKSFMVRQGSVAGVGEILMPVPWQAIAVGTEKRFVLNVDQDKTDSNPKGRKDSAPLPGFAVHMFGFFQAAPEEGMGGEDEVESGSGSGHSQSFDADGKPLPKEL